ncbi:DUF2183 domain-containing protein [Chitinophaga pendula]|uniref:App1 family protein n=1 Tax=Chitinophaga TaxID=79328 RepID=UPI000BAFA487|nr:MULTISPECIES: phosphatase domain-containing protein [Chitinophaga]ASZ10265.1 hypothetical protein CK934_04350 [Chitinophaga sp. MD30]UCJ06777.1 DUF2183 domain-containing protein [Chitinophaga pendula]
MSWMKKILSRLRLTNEVTIKLYHGFGGVEQLEIFGHVLQLSPLPRRKYRQRIFSNMLALLRLFIVKPCPHTTVQLEWEGRVVTAIASDDGFFRLAWRPAVMPAAGWHDVTVSVAEEGLEHIHAKGVVFIPHRSQYGCISDIDDTFLISHSSTIFKRMKILLTRNARTRMPFEGVVQHYQLLSQREGGALPNPFFYVSSSEWNLYDYILEFSHTHELPLGVYLLSQLKPWYLLWKSGQNKHATKFTRISRILSSYPHMRFVLLGDDTQEDPNIYRALAVHFPEQIICIYFRHIRKDRFTAVSALVGEIKHMGIPCCYFSHSHEAIVHSRQIGLIS